MGDNTSKMFQGTKREFSSTEDECVVVVIKKRKVGINEYNPICYEIPSLMESPLGKLSEEVLSKLFDYLTFNDLSTLALTSKAVSIVVINHFISEAFVKRTIKQLGDFSLCDKLQCFRLGRLLKCATMLQSGTLRMKLFYQFIVKVQSPFLTDVLMKPTMSERLEMTMIHCFGHVLQSFIAGWHEGECLKVFVFLCEKMLITQSLMRFVMGKIGGDKQNERFLRHHLRSLFMDPCVNDQEKALWIGFIADQINTAQLAKVILLLYGPLNSNGDVEWRFPLNVQSFKLHTSVFKSLARVIGSLRLVPKWSPFLSLEVLVYISNEPCCWLLRSFSSLLLPLSCIDKELAVDYFAVLYSSGRASTASLLMALCMMVSPQFVNSKPAGVVVDEKCAHQLISNVLKSPKLAAYERYSLVKKLWSAVFNLGDEFSQTAIEGDEDDAADDFADLMDAWMEVSIALMSD